MGPYPNPPQPVIILCVDEKSRIQASDRTQPGLPIKNGRCGTLTHDYKRNGISQPLVLWRCAAAIAIARRAPRAV